MPNNGVEKLDDCDEEACDFGDTGPTCDNGRLRMYAYGYATGMLHTGDACVMCMRHSCQLC